MIELNDQMGMLMIKRLGCLFFMLLLISCQANPLADFFNTQPAASQNAGILFTDDFSDTTSGWDRQRSTDGITDYDGGRYLIQVDRANYDYFANPSMSLPDVRIEVEAVNAGGETDNEFGLICRYSGKNDFYAGLISSDGFYGIFKVRGGEYSLLGMDAMAKSGAINTHSEEKNLIRLDCKGQELKLFVNGVQLDARQDADLSTGDVGLLAGSYQNPGVKIYFDNFIVQKP
jgi:hypothetical protein